MEADAQAGSRGRRQAGRAGRAGGRRGEQGGRRPGQIWANADDPLSIS